MNLARHVFIDGILRRSRGTIRIAKALGDEHYMRRQWNWSSTGALGSNNCVFAVGGPWYGTGASIVRSWIVPPQSFTTEAVDWGYQSYLTGYPTENRFILHYIKIDLTIDQVNEDGKVQVIFCKPRRAKYPFVPTGNANGTLSLPLPNFSEDFDQPFNYAQWKIYFNKLFKYEIYGQSGTTFNRQRSLTFFLPINRCYQTASGVDPTSADSFFRIMTAGDHEKRLHMYIRTNDAAAADGQYFNFQMRVEWKFSQING